MNNKNVSFRRREVLGTFSLTLKGKTMAEIEVK